MKFICLRRMIDKNRISMHTVSCYNLYRFTFSIHIFTFLKFSEHIFREHEP